MRKDFFNMMFYGAKIKNNCFYFIKTLSESKNLVRFVDEMEDNSFSYSMMPKWTTSNGIDSKLFFRNGSSSDSRTYQKCLYIINSLDSGIRYCLGLFCENSEFTSFDMNNLTLYRVNDPADKKINSIVENKDNDLYSAYIFINNEPGKIKVTFNQNGQAFTLDESSVFVVSNNENIDIEYDSNDSLYFAKADVFFDTK